MLEKDTSPFYFSITFLYILNISSIDLHGDKTFSQGFL